MMTDPRVNIVELLHDIDKKVDIIVSQTQQHEKLDDERFASVGRTIQLMAGGGAAFATILAGIVTAVIALVR